MSHRIPLRSASASLRVAGSNRPGVVLVITLLAILLLAAMILFVINLGQQVNRRIEMQNAADGTAIAGSTWVARSLNLVATNNISMAWDIASVNVMDSLPQATAFAYHEQVSFRDRLEQQLATGISDAPPDQLRDYVRDQMEQLLDELNDEVEQLEPMDEFFNRDFDVTELTHYNGGNGRIWRAMYAKDELNRAVIESLPDLTQQVAVDGGRSAVHRRGDFASFMTPVRPVIPIERGQFNDFEHPVKFGTLPDSRDHRVYNRGPFDTVYGWHELRWGSEEQRDRNMDHYDWPGGDMQGALENPFDPAIADLPVNALAGAADRLAVLAMPGRLMTEIALSYVPGGGGDRPPSRGGGGSSVVIGYTTYGPQNYMLRRVNWFQNRQLRHSRWDMWMRQLANAKLNYLWPGLGGTHNDEADLRTIREPEWVTDFNEALELANQPGEIRETAFFEVEIKSRYPPEHPNFLDDGTWAPRRGRRYPRITRINGWQDPRVWEQHPEFQRVADYGWRRDWVYYVWWDPDIGLDPQIDADGERIPQPVYYFGHYYFAGVNIGDPVDIGDPYQGFNQNGSDAPAPTDFVPGMVTFHEDDRLEYLTFLGVARHRDTAEAWPERFNSGKPYPNVVGMAQAKVFNNHSWDLWTHMWHAKLEPIRDYEHWAQVMDAQIDVTHEEVERQDLEDVAELLRHTTDVAEVLLGDGNGSAPDNDNGNGGF